jgi:nucleotide-binding universal stress UspA family protein
MNLAQQFSANINFCHVVEPSVIVSAGNPDFEELEGLRRSYGLDRMTKLIENNRANNRNCKGEVLLGDIVDEVVKYAKDENADMIVIGTHGAKGLEKILLGRAFCKKTVDNKIREYFN